MNRRKGVVLSYILMIFEVFSTLLLTPFIIKTLGLAEYGVYKLSAAITAYLLLLDLGVGNAITRFIAKFKVENNKERAEKFLGVATVFYAFIAVVSIVIGVVLVMIFPNFFAKGLTKTEIVLGQKLLLVTALNSAVTLGTSAYTNVLIAYEKFTVSKGANILQIVIRVILTYIVLVLGKGSLGLVVVNFITTIVCRLFYVVYVLNVIKLKPIFKNIEKDFIREIIIYSSLIFLQMIATQLNASVDQILIGSLVASSSVILGIYGVGTQLVQYFQQLGTAFTGVLMPGIVKMIEEKTDSLSITNEMIRIGRIILLFLALIWGGFIVVGSDFIVSWAGELNYQAYYVATILMTVYMFILSESVGTQVLWAMNEHKEQSYLKILIVLLNILLTVLLIKWDPLIGATLGTFISLLLGDVVVMNIVFVKKINMSLSYYYKGLLKGILPSISISIVVGFLFKRIINFSGWYLVLSIGLIICLTYFVLLMCFGMNEYEKSLIYSVLNKSKGYKFYIKTREEK